MLVFFTTATIAASVILFQGINDTSGTDLVSIFCGFITIFIGVFLLNAPKHHHAGHDAESFKIAVGGNTLLHNFDEENLGFVGLNEYGGFVGVSDTELSPSPTARR